MLLEKEKLATENAKKSLLSEDFPKYLDYLYQLGVHTEKNFIPTIKNKEILENNNKIKEQRRKYIQNQIDTQTFYDDFASLEKRLWSLSCLATAWEDPGLSREKNENSARQTLKLKKNIDKSFRHFIHIGLLVEVAKIRNETTRMVNKNNNELQENFILDPKNNKRPNPFDKKTISSLEEKKPFEILGECIILLKGETPENIEQIVKKATKAISSFKPLSDKFLQALGIFIAFLASLACGLSVGGCAFLLFMGLTPVTFFLLPLIPSAVISVIAVCVVFGVNFSFLYKSIPEILLSAAKMGGITEYFDPEGKRAQLSKFKKFLLLPAAVVSFAVGVSMMAFTVTNFVKILAGVFPALAFSVASSFLPTLIGILIVGLGIALSILMFKGFVWLLQKPLLELAKQALVHMRELSFLGWLGLSVKLLIFGLSLVGLYTLYFAGIPILVPFFGPAAALIGWAAFLGEIPFTTMMVNQLCDLASNFLVNITTKAYNFCFARQNIEELPEEKTDFKQILCFFFVPINALFNALLVIGTSIISLVSTVACFIISFASNLIVSNKNQENKRNQADVYSLVSICKNGVNQNNTLTIASANNRANSPSFFSLDDHQRPKEKHDAKVSKTYIYPDPSPRYNGL